MTEKEFVWEIINEFPAYGNEWLDLYEDSSVPFYLIIMVIVLKLGNEMTRINNMSVPINRVVVKDDYDEIRHNVYHYIMSNKEFICFKLL